MEAIEDRVESLTQKRSHGSSDKEHPVLFRPLSQSRALLTGEREETLPFSVHLSDLEPRSTLMLVELQFEWETFFVFWFNLVSNALWTQR
jgi:hypothetical protein